MYCRKCGSELRNTDVFCTNCGEKIADGYKNDVENITQKRQTKFDRFMKKTFFQNKDFTNEEYEKAGKFCVAIIVLFQFIAMFLVLFFDVEIPTGGGLLICWLLDCYILNQLSIRGKWKIWGVIAIPVYLCIRAKKTDKKYTWAIVSILVCALGIGGAFVSEFHEGTEIKNSSANESLYIWEVEGYVKSQPENAEEVDLTNYIPSVGQEYTYAQWIDGSYSNAIYTLETAFEQENDIYFSGHLVDENKELIASTGYGYYWYDEQYNCVYKTYTENMLGNESTNVIMIPNNASYTFDDGTEIASPPHLFTVTTQAGEFQDCLCEGTTKEEADGTYVDVEFYAPNVGLVLTVSRSPHTKSVYGVDGFAVTYELTDIEIANQSVNDANDESLQSKNEDVSDENSSEKIANDEIVNNSEIANNEYASNETVINEEVTSDNVLISENTENESIDLNDYPLTNESNNEDFNAYGENSVVFSNGLKITVPDSWIGIYDTYETSDTYVVCDGYAGGNLLDIELITSESELDSLNKWAVLGYYYDNNMAIGLVLSYPNYETYDANGGAMASNGLYKEVDKLIYDTSGIANFAFCDEQTLRSVLSK